MSRGRAWRRAQMARIKARAQTYYWVKSCVKSFPEHAMTIIGRAWQTPKPCSCYMCGNPRRYFKELTFQEKTVLSEKPTDFSDNSPREEGSDMPG